MLRVNCLEYLLDPLQPLLPPCTDSNRPWSCRRILCCVLSKVPEMQLNLPCTLLVILSRPTPCYFKQQAARWYPIQIAFEVFWMGLSFLPFGHILHEFCLFEEIKHKFFKRGRGPNFNSRDKTKQSDPKYGSNFSSLFWFGADCDEKYCDDVPTAC